MANVIRPEEDPRDVRPEQRRTDRRGFFKWIGAGVGTAAFVAGCDLIEDIPFPFNTGTTDPITLDFSNDFGVLNYAYVLEQLEAAFYVRAAGTPFSDINDEERRILRDLRNHEVIHREFFRQGIPALGGTAVPALRFDFSAIDFSSRASVLGTAKVFEDLGVAAYNGAANLLDSTDILLVAGKIVSVEARHAAAIRDLLNPLDAEMGFAGDDVIDENGLDRAFDPATVLASAAAFVKNPISVTGL